MKIDRFRLVTRLGLWGLLLLVLAAPAFGQRRRGGRPETVDFTTKDGVALTGIYYPSNEEKAAPVVLLHDYKESRATFDAFARRLQNPERDEEEPAENAPQQPSFAVLAVDLRGHGGSTKQHDQFGNSRELDAAKLRKQDFYDMAAHDMEAVRKFLVGKNDAGALNLNKLSLVGVGMGASVATIWAAADWSAPPLAVGKQGQDVKALVLVSPRWKDRGLLIQRALQQRGVQREVAMMLIYGGDDSRVKADAKRIYGQLERFHPEPKSSADEASRDLVALNWPMKLQGSPLLRKVGQPAQDKIIDFLTKHTAESDHPWTKRRDRS